jgi:hypothetical protein
MSSPNTGGVDLESVLNVCRRTLASIGETSLRHHQYRYTDTIYLKREDSTNSLLSIDSKIHIFGELQLLCGIFERYSSNINVYEESIESNSNKTSFSTTFEENEDIDEEDTDTPAVTSKLRQTSISSQSSSPPITSDSPIKRKKLSAIGRSPTAASTMSDYSIPNLEGKRYGCVEIPNMNLIEILEILLRAGLELVDQSSDYDKENILHQNFIFSINRQTAQKSGYAVFPRSSSFIST